MRTLVIAALGLALGGTSATAAPKATPQPAPARPAPRPAASHYQPDAATSTDPRWQAGVAAWQAAEGTRGMRIPIEMWEAAARLFEMLDTADGAVAAALAWDHVVRGTPQVITMTIADATTPPEPLDAHEQRVVAEVARFFALAGPTTADARAVAARYARGQAFWRRGHDDEAAPDLEDIVVHHPDHDVAVYAAKLLLDGLNRRQHYDELFHWVEVMLATPALVAQDEALATSLHKIQRQFMRRSAENAEREHAYARCEEIYARLFATDPASPDSDEILYNAALCATGAGDAPAATVHYRDLVRIAPTSKLAPRALENLAVEHIATGAFAQAAAEEERLAATAPQLSGAQDALENAAMLRAVLGDTGAAERDLERAARTSEARWSTWTVRWLALANLELVRGERASARRALDHALALAQGPEPALVALAWELACTTPLVDGVCTGTRDSRVTSAALATARAARRDSDELVIADDVLERALAGADPDLARRAHDAPVPLSHAPDPDVAIVAHAGLARLFHHGNDRAGERAELVGCRDEALAGLRAAWLASCEGRLVALGDAAPPHVVVPRPRAGTFPIEPEPQPQPEPEPGS